MAGVTVELIGLDALLAGFELIAVESQALGSLAVLEATHDAQSMAEDLSPVRTGYFKSRWQTQLVAPMSAELSNDAHYALFLIFGHMTRNHAWFVPPQDCLTPAMVYGKMQLYVRLKATLGGL